MANAMAGTCTARPAHGGVYTAQPVHGGIYTAQPVHGGIPYPVRAKSTAFYTHHRVHGVRSRSTVHPVIIRTSTGAGMLDFGWFLHAFPGSGAGRTA